MTEDDMNDEDVQRTIRMFPDHVGRVLWIRDPIAYEKTGLSGELVAELKAWEQYYYDSLDSDFNWVPGTAARTCTEEGVRLARLVSAEVGPQFVVEFASYEDGAETVRMRADQPAQNAIAKAAFTQLFNEEDAERREAEERRRNNPGGHWIAYAPLSGTVFDPNQGLGAHKSTKRIGPEGDGN